MIVADVSTAAPDASLPSPLPSSFPSLAPESIAGSTHTRADSLPAIQHHASCISAWLRHLSALPLASSAVVAVALTKVPALHPLFLPRHQCMRCFRLTCYRRTCFSTSCHHCCSYLYMRFPLACLPQVRRRIHKYKRVSLVTSLVTWTSQVHRLFHDVAASVLHRRQTLCSLPSSPAIDGATTADRDSPAPVVPQLPSPSPSPSLVAPKTLASVLFALICLLQFLFVNFDGLHQLDPAIPGFSLRRCAGIFPFSSSSITSSFASFSFVTCVLLAANNGYLSSAVVTVIQAYACTLEVISLFIYLRHNTNSILSLPFTAASPTFFSTRGAFLLLLRASRLEGDFCFVFCHASSFV